MTSLYYLGPVGTFTHQAALSAAATLRFYGERDFDLVACDDVPHILQETAAGNGWGIIAWENNVAGFVAQNLDFMIDATNVAAFARIGVDVSFDAFVTQDTVDQAYIHTGHADANSILELCHRVTAHPHGLAQCSHFIDEYHLAEIPSRSNAAACRDLQANEVALGPALCAQLYGLHRVSSGVQDFSAAHTEFLVIAPRNEMPELLHYAQQHGVKEFESIIAFIPLATGPGVLANVLDVIRDTGLNMTSFISRPIKGHGGTYSFFATIDAAPWEPSFASALTEIAQHGDWLKTLAVYPRGERPHPPVDEWMLPAGGIRLNPENNHDADIHAAAMRKELLW